jgi:excisionase family DNA binding protein
MTHDGPEHGSVEEAAERLISLAEAAELFELSHSHLRKLVREGKIWGKQIGRYWVTTEEAVAKYLAQDRHPGPKPRER